MLRRSILLGGELPSNFIAFVVQHIMNLRARIWDYLYRRDCDSSASWKSKQKQKYSLPCICHFNSNVISTPFPRKRITNAYACYLSYTPLTSFEARRTRVRGHCLDFNASQCICSTCIPCIHMHINTHNKCNVYNSAYEFYFYNVKSNALLNISQSDAQLQINQTDN